MPGRRPKDQAPGASPRSGTPPPEASRWKKGQSGNPKGRPSRTPITDALRDILEQVHQGKPVSRHLAERMMKEALSGKFPFAKEIYDRIEGKTADDPPQPAGPAIVFEICEATREDVERARREREGGSA